MKKSAIAVLAILAVAVSHATLVSVTLAENIEQHIETIAIQTMTISDEQFLKGDASGRPTIISGTLKDTFRSLFFCTVQVELRRMPPYGRGYLRRWVYLPLQLIHLLDAGS
jgi:hypothetical protein